MSEYDKQIGGSHYQKYKIQPSKFVIENNLPFAEGSVIKYKDAYLIHILNVLNLDCIDTNKIKKKNFKVVVDTVNGAAYKALPTLLEKLNCDVIKIHCDNTGTFPRGTEPIPSHLRDLSKSVKENNADIGLATDPDADRLATTFFSLFNVKCLEACAIIRKVL